MAIEIKVNLSGTEQVDSLANNVNQTTESVKSLKQQFIDARKELMNMSESDPGFLEKAAQAGRLKDQISDMNAVIKATAGSTTENLGNALTGVASIGIGAFQGIASAAALLGVESEDTQKILVQLQAAAGMADAIKSFGQFGDTITEVKAALASVGILTVKNTVAKQADVVVTGEQVVATEGATVAQYGLNTAMLANPIFLVIAAIGALVAAYMYFSSTADDAAEKEKALRVEREKHAKLIEKDLEQWDKHAKLRKGGTIDMENEISIMKAKGATDKEIYEAERKLLKQRQLNLQYHKGFRGKLNAEEIEEAKKLRGALKVLDAEYQSDITDKEAEAEEKRKAAREKYANERMAAMGRIRAAEIEYLDSKLSSEDKEIVSSKRKYDELIALANKFNIDNSALLIARKQTEAAIVKKYDDEEKKIAEQKAKDARALSINNNVIKAETELNKTKLEIQKATGLELIRLILLQQEQEKKLLSMQQAEDLENAGTNEVLKDKIRSEYALKRQKLEDDFKNKSLKNNAEVLTSDEERIKKLEGYIAISDKVGEKIDQISGLTNTFFDIGNQRRAQESEDELSKYQEGTTAYDEAKKRQTQIAEKAAERQFYINKAFQLGSAINDATGAILTSLKSAPPVIGLAPNPAGIAALAFVTATGIANVAKIAASKYKSSSSAAPSNTTPNLGSNQSSNPQYNLFGNNNDRNTTNANMQQQVNVNNQVTVKAVVSETEITNTQKRVARYKNSAEL